LMQKLLTT